MSLEQSLKNSFEQIGKDIKEVKSQVVAAQQYYYGEVSADPANPILSGYWTLKTETIGSVPLAAQIGAPLFFTPNMNTFETPSTHKYEWSVKTSDGIKRMLLQ